MTRLVVFGGNGYAGSAIVAEATERGLDVTAVGRSATGPGSVAGSVTDPATVEQVAAGADVLAVATPPAAALESVGTLVDAARRHGARLAYVGGAGSLLVAEGGPRLVDTPDFREEWKPEALAHAQVLEALRRAPADLDWFYVSPAASFGAWTTTPTTGTYRTSDDVLLTDDQGRSEISGRDFARAFVDEVVTPRHSRRRFTVAR
jgi:uncharacterized protein